MAEFKRFRIHATLETEVMLLADAELAHAIDEVSEKLRHTGLTLVAVEPEEVVTEPAALPVGYDD
jgi:hypothetical protein